MAEEESPTDPAEEPLLTLLLLSSVSNLDIPGARPGFLQRLVTAISFDQSEDADGVKAPRPDQDSDLSEHTVLGLTATGRGFSSPGRCCLCRAGRWSPLPPWEVVSRMKCRACRGPYVAAD